MPREIEYVAAALAVLYLLLAIRQWRSCWVAAFVSSCLYVLVLFHARLYMESLLNAFYAAMAIYGYRCWRIDGADEPASRVHRWPLQRHLQGFLGVLVLAALNSVVLARYTPAAWPFVDSLVTWSSVFATFLVARKVYENWHWWLVIDSLTMFLSWARGLYTTALLFALYLVMIIVGMREWRRDLQPAHA
ncbi:MAG: nicotinamide riboside transporter PnuC [Steroidobacterales bacterium]